MYESVKLDRVVQYVWLRRRASLERISDQANDHENEINKLRCRGKAPIAFDNNRFWFLEKQCNRPKIRFFFFKDKNMRKSIWTNCHDCHDCRLKANEFLCYIDIIWYRFNRFMLYTPRMEWKFIDNYKLFDITFDILKYFFCSIWFDELFADPTKESFFYFDTTKQRRQQANSSYLI